MKHHKVYDITHFRHLHFNKCMACYHVQISVNLLSTCKAHKGVWGF